MNKYIALLLALIVTLTACGTETPASGPSSPSPPQAETPSATPTDTETVPAPSPAVTPSFASDAAFLVETIETVHPIFLMPEMLPDTYEAARSNLLAVSNDASTQAFVFAARRYIAALQDGHMSGIFGIFEQPRRNDWRPFIFGDFLDAEWTARDSRLFLLNETDAEVLEIGGISVSEIFKVVDTYYFSENETDRLRTYSIFTRYSTVLEMAGVDTAGGEVPLYIRDGNGETRTEYISVDVSWQAVLASPTPQYDYIIRHEMMGDVFFIDLRTFTDGQHIDETVKYIEAAIKDGVRKFIVDLRGNGGGNSYAGQRLLEAMGISVPHYGGVRRLSALAREQRVQFMPELAVMEEEYIKFEPNTETAQNPNNVFVSVLSDADTYSSATMFGVWVQDGDFGNIVGSPSRNAPSAFGDMLNAELPYSRIILSVSYTRFLRPDASADQSTLWPDIMTDPSGALDAALEFMRTLDIP
jgi:hypothetical protein